MEFNSEKNVSIAGIRKKTRKAVRPGVGESNIGIGSTSISRPSLVGIEKQRHEESNLSSIFSKRTTNLKVERKSEPGDENRVVSLGLNISSMGLNNRNKDIDGKSSILKKSFKEDMIEQTIVVAKEDVEKQAELNSGLNCPFLVGSGSEASYERSNDIKTVLRKNKYDSRVDYGYNYGEDMVSLKDLISGTNDESMGMFSTTHDVEELSKWFSKMVSIFETFGLNIQGNLEKLEQDLEADTKDLRNFSVDFEETGIGNNELVNENNTQYDPIKISERYSELISLKNKLLEELSNVENEIMLEEMRIKKEESERRIRIEEYKNTREIYKDELSSLTIIICWIEDCLQNFVYPIQKKQSEYKMEISRESEILKLIQEEIYKIEKQEKVVLEKLREIQEIKRYKGEEKEILEEQIRLSQASKSDKIKNANFKEASMISQTIQVLQKEVLELEDSYSNVLHQEKEFMEKIERIRKSHQDETNRMDACKHEILLNRKQRRQQLKLKVEQLKECKFSLNSEAISENMSIILNSLSEKFYSQIHSVLSFEISLMNKQDLEDEREHGIREIQTQNGGNETTETTETTETAETISLLENQKLQATSDSESESKSKPTLNKESPPTDKNVSAPEDYHQPKIQPNEQIPQFKDSDCSFSDSYNDDKSGLDGKDHDSQVVSCDLVDTYNTHNAEQIDSNLDQTTKLESNNSKKEFGDDDVN
ncbi:uncharacterized protein cubi_00937 [Cryptosporidium ubiquitum]|uniref:Uncharacterized protein n=1 Tax=Cryptosporidium ubiquitum TaxID=857276 RepID=A0A1J4M996_9CRYT|nr:uncharacterized protein cubi_00937 [Cryptosporidium ubiquitum]OII70792.1 hypothetical protein cubi_00937 [Cryptosporidium ubiquitum]